MFSLYGSQSTNFTMKSIDWFLYDEKYEFLATGPKFPEIIRKPEV